MDAIFAPGDKMKRARQHENWTNRFVVYNIDDLRDENQLNQIFRAAGLSGNGLIRMDCVVMALIALNGIEVPVEVVCRLAISLGYTCAQLKEIGPRHQLLTLCEQGLIRIVRRV
jgi:hypothetical protein